MTIETCNATKHAEIVAIENFLSQNPYKDITDLSQCELFVTVEPCNMCAAALSIMKVGSVVFECKNERFRGNGSILNVQNSLMSCNYPKYTSIGS